jgi:polyisoprenoid-binding protein YceI
MLKTIFVATAAIALAASAQAQSPAAQSGTYKLEPNHTQVFFGVNHLGISNYYGSFSGASGSLTLDTAKPAASKLDISVPVASVHTPSEKLNGELSSAGWLDAEAFPTMTFRSTAVTPTGPNTADVTGNLTLHGITKPVTLKAKFHGAAPNPMSKVYTVGFDVTGAIKRSDFGVSTYVPLISDNVDLIITAAFEKTGS